MSGVKIKNIIKRSISLSPLVNRWAEELAAERGFGTNFSAFIADLVRREQDAAKAAPLPAQDPEKILREVRPKRAKASNA